jgi:hypothetical protein
MMMVILESEEATSLENSSRIDVALVRTAQYARDIPE